MAAAMNLISIKSFWSSGGSAVNDLLSEFSSCKVMREQEIILFEGLDGLLDLEARVCSNRNNIPVGSQIARFARLIDVLSRYGLYTIPYDHKSFFDGYFRKRSMQFIEEISLGNVKASIAMEWHLVPSIEFLLRYKAYSRIKHEFGGLLQKIMPSSFNRSIKRKNFHPKADYYIPADPERFVKAVTSYVNDLFDYLLSREVCEGKHLVLDQMLNIDCFLKYKNRIKNLKYVIVDRDPRDVFVGQMLRWNSLAVPKNVDDFIVWYRGARAAVSESVKAECLYLRFEDLIFNYDSSVERVLSYLSLSDEEHDKKLRYFDPAHSIVNTQMFRSYSNQEDIKKIERELSQYLYDFPNYKKYDLNQIF